MAQNPTDQANTPQVILGWIWVGIPLAVAVFVTFQNAIKLFQ